MDIPKVADRLAYERRQDGAEVVAAEIETHSGAEFIIEYRGHTRSGHVRLDGYNLTRFETDSETGGPVSDELKAARFNSDLTPNEQGTFVCLIHPDEGHTSVITATGSIRWVTSWAVALSDDPNLNVEIMQEMEDSPRLLGW